MRIAVVGGGPAGMMAAIAAGEQGADVTLFDGNEKLGKKLYITGKGRCNVTNDADSDAFFKNIPRNPRFLYSCYAAFDNEALMKRIEDAGVPLKVERGGRVFPQSDKASDITKALERMMSKSGVRVCLRSKVKEILPSDGGFDLCLPGQTRHFDRVILACGGASYPSTGSDGSGYALAKGLPVHAAGFRPIAEAIVTRGGVSVKEVDPKTMESKIVPGVYLCGEMLDVDGFTGGFNIQIAASTGCAAGRAAGSR